MKNRATSSPQATTKIASSTMAETMTAYPSGPVSPRSRRGAPHQVLSAETTVNMRHPPGLSEADVDALGERVDDEGGEDRQQDRAGDLQLPGGRLGPRQRLGADLIPQRVRPLQQGPADLRAGAAGTVHDLPDIAQLRHPDPVAQLP